jgi:heat shock protein HtpX
MSGTSCVSFNIEAEVTPAYYEELLDYVHQNYLQSSSLQFANVRRSVVDGYHVLDFARIESKGKWRIDVSIKIGMPIQVTLTPSDVAVPQLFLDELKEDLIITVQFFKEYVRNSTVYFAWVQGEAVVPEKSPFRRARIIERIFFGNILFLFVLLMAVSITLFFIFGFYAALLIVAFQLMTVIFSDKLISTLSDWAITKQNRTVHILQYHLSPKEREIVTQKYGKEKLLQMKKEIYEDTIGIGKPIDCETAREVMSKYGLICSPENMATKTIDVYALVEKTSEKYEIPTPKIVLSNTMVTNAAASGPSPKRGIVLITTGLLVQLDEEEILSVLGHEFSHLNARDPFILFGLVTGEYLFRLFVLLPYIQYFGFLYLIFIVGAIYFVAKFFEARADLDSAIKIGNPKVLAGALRKIGFRRLQFERFHSSKFQDWVTWDPHPPIYFRIERLEKFESTLEVKHTFVQSAKDCIRGFFAIF